MKDFDLSFTQRGLSLKYKGVTVIRRSTLYVVSPGWTQLLFGLPGATHDTSCIDIPGGKRARFQAANENFSATYDVKMLDTDEVIIDLTYRLFKDIPAEIEYCLGYFSAPLLADSPFEAETSEGRRSGIVPHSAKSSGRQENMLVPPFDRLVLDTRLAKIAVEISGDESHMVIFDARRDPQPWAREAPIFWCGAGLPPLPVKFGQEHHITARLKFTDRTEAGSGRAIAPDSIRLTPVRNAKLPVEETPKIIPEPKQAEFTERDFEITPNTIIVLPDKPTRDDYFAAECLNEELREIYDLELKVVPAGEAPSGHGTIVLGEPSRHSVLTKTCRDLGIEPPANEEGYVLKACPQFVLVAGSDVRGTFYGVQTLLQLLKPTVNGAAVRGALVSDWPTMEFRGAHVFIGSEAKPFLKKLIRRVFARHKMNHLVIQADYTKWDSHPEIHLPWSTSKADLKEIIACAREHHMEVTPLVQSLGHSEWMFKNNQNLHLAEDAKSPYGYCPSNPESYEFIFEIYDEVLELFKPEYFHIGHDEVTMRGNFPHDEKCRQKSVTELFIADVKKLHDYFAAKGVRVMMWGDMMLYKTETPDAGWAESLEGAKERRDLLPRDIVIADWHYCAAEDFPTVRMFKDLGHEVIACTWYTPQNIEDFSRSSKKDGALGLMQTLWAGYNINEGVLGPSFQQFHAYILAAEYAWNTGETSLADLGYDPAEEFNKLWKREKADHSSKDGFTIDLSPFANVTLAKAENSWLGHGPQHELRTFKTGTVRLRGINFFVPKNGAVLLAGPMNRAGEWPSGLRLPIGRKAENLVFLLATGRHAEKGAKVGRIEVRYSNAEAMVIDLVYGENIAAWDDLSAAPSAQIAWIGKTPEGDRAALRILDWRNPSPDRDIQSIEITSSGTEASPILFAITGLGE